MRRLLQNRRTEPYQQERPENRHRRIHLPRRSGTDRHDPLPRLRTETGHPLLRRPANLHPRPEAGLHRPPRTSRRGFPRTRPGQSHPRMGRRTALRRKRPDETLGIHIAAASRTAPLSATPRLPRIFPTAEAYGTWIASKAGNHMRKRDLKGYSGDAYLGIDSGSTTTKIAVTDGEGNLLYHYCPERRRPPSARSAGTRTARRRMCRTRRIARRPGKLFDRIGENLDKGGLLPRRGRGRRPSPTISPPVTSTRRYRSYSTSADRT